MPKLLIVDDEETIRIGLKSMVNRLLPHWEVVGSCEDAEQAWEQVNACSPDLAIIDIGMAGTNGLELALRLNNEKPEVNKIMLTGYDKFSYIQSAMRSGATDYLLKPVQRNELVEAFGKVEILLAEREHRRKLKLEKKIVEWVTVQKAGSCSELEQLLDAEELHGEDIRYGIILRFQYGSIEEAGGEQVTPSASYCFTQPHDADSNIIQLIDVTISNVCEMTFVAVRNMSTLEGCLEHCERNAGRESARLTLTGYGELIEDLHLLPVAFRQAQEMIYQIVKSHKELDTTDEAERMNKLMVSIEMNDLKSVIHLLEQWQLELKEAREQNPLFKFTRLFRFIAFFAGLQTSRSQSALLTELNKQITRLSGQLLFTGDLGALMLAIDQFIEGVNQLKSDLFDERKIIGKVKEIMRREFMNPEFSLEQAALFVHLNPTYLSELFKETAGRKFIDYLTDIRLEEARHILLETDMKMYEVCLSVGYTSSKYFSTLFRKKYQVTPTMYREGQS